MQEITPEELRRTWTDGAPGISRRLWEDFVRGRTIAMAIWRPMCVVFDWIVVPELSRPIAEYRYELGRVGREHVRSYRVYGYPGQVVVEEGLC